MIEIKIPAHVVEAIISAFPDRRSDIGPGPTKLSSMDQIMFHAGQQSVIDFIRNCKS